jgi:SHAQKYF class myb-like DNA-binding protein
MASEPTHLGDRAGLSAKQTEIPRVISMPASANTAQKKSAPMPLSTMSQNPSVACMKKGAVAGTKPTLAPAISYQYQKKTNRSSSVVDTGDNAASGRWTAAEHEAFLAGLKVYGREWKKVAQCIPTRSAAQIRSHAQKYFNKVSKEQQEMVAFEATRHMSCPASLTLKSDSSGQKPVISSSYHRFVKELSHHPESAELKVNNALQSLYTRKAELEDHLRRIKSEEMPKVDPIDATSAQSMGPASAALKAEQQSLRKAAIARFHEKKRSRTPSPKESPNTNTKCCPNVSLATMPSSGEFDSGEVLALSLLGGNFKRDNIENNLRGSPSKLRKREHSTEK